VTNHEEELKNRTENESEGTKERNRSKARDRGDRRLGDEEQKARSFGLFEGDRIMVPHLPEIVKQKLSNWRKEVNQSLVQQQQLQSHLLFQQQIASDVSLVVATKTG